MEVALMMSTAVKTALFAALSLVMSGTAISQTSYRVVPLSDSGTITGSVKWSGPVPRLLTFPINKDIQVCDPESRKTRDLERLIVGAHGGVANTVVFLKNVYSGKPFNFPESRRFLDQKSCRYEPHILLVAQDAALRMNSSDPVLHTVHMDGAASYNLPFPFTNQTVSRTMQSPGLVNIKCNGGHVWMNAEIMVAPHPYYAVTDESGKFELTDVPPGEYEIVAWHEGWSLLGQQAAFDVLTQRKIQRPIFSDPRIWQKKVSVDHNGAAVNFVLSEK